MASTVINTRADLNAIAGTPEHAAFMAVLAGSLWRVEKDGNGWKAVEDNSTIARFGFSRADFPDAVPPDLPAAQPVEQIMAQTIRDYEAALDRHLDSVAHAHGFPSGRHSLALRAAYPGEWQALGTAFGIWMDECNALSYAGVQEVKAGTRPLPALEEFIAALPEFVAPE